MITTVISTMSVVIFVVTIMAINITWSQDLDGGEEIMLLYRFKTATNLLPTAFAAVVIAVAACTPPSQQSLDPSNHTAGWSAVATASPAAESTLASEEPVLGVGICLDGTLSFDEMLERARSGITTELRRFAATPHPAAFLAVRWITTSEMTRTPSAVIGEWVLPSLSPLPGTPQPVATPDIGPFGGSELAEATKAAAEAEATATMMVATRQARLAQNQEAAKKIAQTILEAPAPRAPASDILGCLQLVAELVRRFPQRLVILVSDLEPWKIQNTSASVPLEGMIVRAIFVHCVLAQQCEERQRLLSNFVEPQGGARVDFFYPGESIEGLFQEVVP